MLTQDEVREYVESAKYSCACGKEFSRRANRLMSGVKKCVTCTRREKVFL